MAYYQIGDVFLEWTAENFPLRQDTFILQFQVGEIPPTAEVIRYTTPPLLPDQYAKLIETNGTYDLFQDDEGLSIVYHWAQCRHGFGYRLDDLKKSEPLVCWFHPQMRQQPPLSASRFFSSAGLHSKLLKCGAPVLHAAYVEADGRALLFAAPSGVGKSTQAALWTCYEGARTINGDRVLLRRRNDGWYAYGYPCCGSSNVCFNRTLPLRAIVLLEQDAENRIVPLSEAEKIRALFSGMEVFRWASWEIASALSLAQELAREVPVIRLACRPEREAVSLLKNYLLEERLW